MNSRTMAALFIFRNKPAPNQTPVIRNKPAPNQTPVIRNKPAPNQTPVIRNKPAPVWSSTEIGIMRLLIRANIGFKKAWKDMMQFALLNRSEAATSKKFYALKKGPYGVSLDAFINEQPKDLLQKAFGLLRSVRESALMNESIATLEGVEAEAKEKYEKWKELWVLWHTKREQLTEEQRERAGELLLKTQSYP